MAFLVDREYLGIKLKDSFNVIENTSSYREQGECILQVYVSKEEYEKGSSYIFIENYKFPVKFGESEGSDRYQAYSYLMTLKEFKNSKTILVEQLAEN